MISAVTLGGFFAGSWMRKRKMANEIELRKGTDENLCQDESISPLGFDSLPE